MLLLKMVLLLVLVLAERVHDRVLLKHNPSLIVICILLISSALRIMGCAS